MLNGRIHWYFFSLISQAYFASNDEPIFLGAKKQG